jgi:ribonucleoside-triphosphate reductase
MEPSSKILSEIVTYNNYSKYLPDAGRRETWEETVQRSMDMHTKKYPLLADEIKAAYRFVFDKKVLPSMRSLQFGGKPIEINPARSFNCSYAAVDDVRFFQEAMFLLLGGSGLGYSVQNHHISNLPPVTKPYSKRTKRFLVGDSIEGWADAIGALMKSYFSASSTVEFDFSDIRKKGTLLKTSGGLAPGPQPLKDCIYNIRKILDQKESGDSLTSLEVHDIVCFIADAVLAGGIRRAALIALFDIDDEAMLTCKFGNWWETNPQRARANNSAVVLRHKIKKDRFLELWGKVKASGSGEPGILMSNSKEAGCNPCAEISFSQKTGLCNLTTVNVSDLLSYDNPQAELESRVKAASFIGTLQATYTGFHYLREQWRKTAEKEALLGVSMTGIGSGSLNDLDEEAAAKVAVAENKRAAKLFGINQAARVTCVKPEGTASLVLGTSSGIHAWHSPYFIRRMRILKDKPLYAYLKGKVPSLLEDDVLHPNRDAVLSVPIKAPKTAIFRDESPLDLLERVKRTHKKWIQPGHRKGDNTHNVSCTVSVPPDKWEEVGEWMWLNREYYTGLSVLPYDGGSYVQAPFEECSKETYESMIKKVKDIDLSEVVEGQDTTELKEAIACGGGSCEIR